MARVGLRRPSLLHYLAAQTSDVLTHRVIQQFSGKGLSDPISLKFTALVFRLGVTKRRRPVKKETDCTLYFQYKSEAQWAFFCAMRRRVIWLCTTEYIGHVDHILSRRNKGFCCQHFLIAFDGRVWVFFDTTHDKTSMHSTKPMLH